MKKRKQGIAKVMKSEVEKHFQKCNQNAIQLKEFRRQQAMLGMGGF